MPGAFLSTFHELTPIVLVTLLWENYYFLFYHLCDSWFDISVAFPLHIPFSFLNGTLEILPCLGCSFLIDLSFRREFLEGPVVWTAQNSGLSPLPFWALNISASDASSLCGFSTLLTPIDLLNHHQPFYKFFFFLNIFLYSVDIKPSLVGFDPSSQPPELFHALVLSSSSFVLPPSFLSPS